MTRICDASVGPSDQPLRGDSAFPVPLRVVPGGLISLADHLDLDSDTRWHLGQALLWSPYVQAALPWAVLGHVVIPAAGKNPAIPSWAPYSHGANHDATPRVLLTPAEIVTQVVAWWREHKTERGLLILDSHIDPAEHLSVVDVDDPTYWPWVIETFGQPALVVSSGRIVPVGAGLPGHAYYRGSARSANGLIGPPEAFRWPHWADGADEPKHWGTSPIDLKSRAAYVVAAGSIHSSGRPYTASQPITASTLAALTSFDGPLAVKFIEASKAERANRKLARRGITVSPKATKAQKAAAASAASTKTVTAAEMEPFRSMPKGSKVYCPICAGGSSGTPAASVVSEPHETPKLYCHRCRSIVRAEVAEDALDLRGVFGIDGAPVVSEDAEEDLDQVISAATAPVQQMPRWETPSLQRQPGKVIILPGPLGCGKTEAFAGLLRSEPSARAMGIAPTRKLARTLARRTSAHLYSEGEGALTDDRLAVCLPSIGRAPLANNVYDFILLDEVEELLDLLHSPEVMTRRRSGEDGQSRAENISGATYSHLSSHLRQTLDLGGTVVVADAYPSARLIDELTRLTGRKVEDFVVIAPPKTYKPLAGRTEHRYASMGGLLRVIIERAQQGQGGTIACSTQRDVRGISAMLRALVPASKILEIHADSGDEWADDVTTAWDAADWVVFNQAAGSGVSYTGSTHTTHYTVAPVWFGLTWTSVRQMRGRNRPAGEHHSFVGGTEYLKTVTDREQIRRDALAGAAATLQMVYLGRGPDGRPTYGPREAEHLESFVDCQWVSRLRGRSVRTGYYQSLQAEGCTLVTVAADPTDETIEDSYRDLGEAVVAGDVARMMAAAALTAEAYQGLRDAKRTRTEDEQAALAQYTAVERWGSVAIPSAPTAEKFQKDTITRGSPRWTAAREYQRLVASASGHRDAVKAADRAAGGVPGAVYRGQFRHLDLRARVINKVLSLAGFGQNEWAEPLKVAAENLGTEFGMISVNDKEIAATMLDDSPINQASIVAQNGPASMTTTGHIWSAASLEQMGFSAGVRAADRALKGAITRTLGPCPQDAEGAYKWLGLILRRVGIPTASAGRGCRRIDQAKLQAWAEACSRGYRKLIGEHVEAVETLTGAKIASMKARLQAASALDETEVEDVAEVLALRPLPTHNQKTSTQTVQASGVDFYKDQGRLDEMMAYLEAA